MNSLFSIIINIANPYAAELYEFKAMEYIALCFINWDEICAYLFYTVKRVNQRCVGDE